jgi:hypothetical protein
MKKKLSVLALLAFMFALTSIAPAFAQGPKTGDIWICPSVSTDNPKGMWVIGGSGAYYILKPGTASHVWQGDPENPMDDILNPTHNLEEHASHVHDLAQVNAGQGLYHKLPSYPYLDTGDDMAVVLMHGSMFIEREFDIVISPMSMIYVVPSDVASFDGMTLYANVPLKAAVFW